MENNIEIKKIKMRDYVLYLLARTGDKEILISCLKEVVREVARKTNHIICDEFEDTLPCVLSVVINEPEIFKLDDGYIRLVHPEKSEEYMSSSNLSDEVKEAIYECFLEAIEPLNYALTNIALVEENEKLIKTDKRYIEWLCNLLSECETFSEKHYCLARNSTELSYFLMLPNLFNIVNRYCNENIIYSILTDCDESYVISYRLNDKMQYIKLTQIKLGTSKVHRVTKCNNSKDAIYFPDIALGVTAKSVDTRQKNLETLRKSIVAAKNKKVPYRCILHILNDVYGIYDDE